MKRSIAVCALALLALTGCSSSPDAPVVAPAEVAVTAAPAAPAAATPVVLLTKDEARTAYQALFDAMVPTTMAWVDVAASGDMAKIRAGAPAQGVDNAKFGADLKAVAWPADVQPFADAAVADVIKTAAVFGAMGAAATDEEALAAVEGMPSAENLLALQVALGITS